MINQSARRCGYAAATCRGTGLASSVTHVRTSQTALEAKVTKLEAQICGSMASSLKGLPFLPQ
jgi:hypothetical protein